MDSKGKDRKIYRKRAREISAAVSDFVVELRSASDSLKDSQKKMSQYVENGARLGWLVDPKNKQVHVYRANGKTEILDNPKIVSGEEVLENFELNLKEIW